MIYLFIYFKVPNYVPFYAQNYGVSGFTSGIKTVSL